ncbi:hypothetical protein BDZ94DRAFT_1315480 [Collybia nuda]|uniref:Uncharacterized protein n=1 Tax=Collybia nuda TaxID=64659 RepID=A0A9P5XR26_9AGAR|nr:hypothetical protein BDZ94DRAFT_1315480 [Collybia nuda]
MQDHEYSAMGCTGAEAYAGLDAGCVRVFPLQQQGITTVQSKPITGAEAESDNDEEHKETGAGTCSNISLHYVEMEDGEVVNSETAKSIRKHACTLWALFLLEGRAPATWDAVDAATGSHYHHDMHTKFPELALCHDNWKSEQVAIDNYPGWQKARKASQGNKIKKEPCVENERKQLLSTGSTSTPKRSKSSPPSVNLMDSNTLTSLAAR